MTDKHGQTQTQANLPAAIVLFGLDEHGKPKAASSATPTPSSQPKRLVSSI
jgi:hypothetical protein